MAKVIFRGMLPPDDPVYREGYKIITEKNLNPDWVKKKMDEQKLNDVEHKRTKDNR